MDDHTPITTPPTAAALQPASDQFVSERLRLVAWINLHDCGVEPTGVLRADGAIDIRCTAVARNGEVSVEIDTVHTYRQARDVLGY